MFPHTHTNAHKHTPANNPTGILGVELDLLAFGIILSLSFSSSTEFNAHTRAHTYIGIYIHTHTHAVVASGCLVIFRERKRGRRGGNKKSLRTNAQHHKNNHTPDSTERGLHIVSCSTALYMSLK